jgi:twitching motility protein PilI
MLDQKSLHDFQLQLEEKLERAQVSAVSSAKLGFVAGGQYCLVNLDQVNEVITVPALTEVPWAHAWFVGVASVRGALFGCTDLAAFLHLAPPMPAGITNLLLVHPRFGINAALRIERALGLRALAVLTPEPRSPDAASWEVCRWHDTEGQQWVEISLQNLVAMPEFLNPAL